MHVPTDAARSYKGLGENKGEVELIGRTRERRCVGLRHSLSGSYQEHDRTSVLVLIFCFGPVQGGGFLRNPIAWGVLNPPPLFLKMVCGGV